MTWNNVVANSNKGKAKTKEISGICVSGLWSKFPSIQKSWWFYGTWTGIWSGTYICAQAYHILKLNSGYLLPQTLQTLSKSVIFLSSFLEALVVAVRTLSLLSSQKTNTNLDFLTSKNCINVHAQIWICNLSYANLSVLFSHAASWGAWTLPMRTCIKKCSILFINFKTLRWAYRLKYNNKMSIIT